jgi:hypothetical protein
VFLETKIENLGNSYSGISLKDKLSVDETALLIAK